MAQKTCTESQAGLPDKKIWVDERYDSYERFFDHNWARRFLGLSQGKTFDPAALDLCTDWKGAASNASMPWLLIFTLQSFHRGYMQRNEPFWRRLTIAIRRHIIGNKSISLSNRQRKKLAGIIDGLGLQVQNEMSQRPPELSAEQLWRDYLTVPEFNLALWSSQRICYGAIYHAYENFLREFASIKKPQLRDALAKISKVKDALADILGKATTYKLLEENDVVIARLVRNALAHNGGRASHKLLAMQHPLRIEEGVVQIMAPDVRQLFDLLKKKVMLLAEQAPSDLR